VPQKNLAAASSDHRGREKRTTVSGQHSQRAREGKKQKRKETKGKRALAALLYRWHWRASRGRAAAAQETALPAEHQQPHDE